MNQYLKFPNFDPIVFSIGPISLHWYGAMYLFGVLGAFYLAKRRVDKSNNQWTLQQVENLLFWGFLGLFIGGRLGYVFFYNFATFIKNPIVLFKVWEGGMSFHGGLIGAIFVIAIFAKKANKTFMQVGDFVAPLVPIGLMFGRFGNFINGELWGRVTNLPIGMLFPTSSYADFKFVQSHPEWFSLYSKLNGILPRHPSQIYEMVFEGIVLFIILNIFIRKPRPTGAVSGVFLFCYGLFRFVIEFFRQPDEQLGLFLNIISMGQILCLPMIIGGILILLFSYRFNNKAKTR
ncbi:prolipoprotein diacylglyceryl transferase [Gilliamella sp. Choc4-2]|uniref:prolipoprotein diacylglyceryl transferase n=1 Tax=unclassified Gilliamella TaxID=2685620 RepID=UPI00080E302A|nr:prolipoprotein diacylglyceryl transferase [Gilliamella apicola]OCG33205.1 prolipoprotein diacylglyceryl transferase [Gilliamella apicola]OCG45575.1 prolipoprotein diacylglyceryl transferase [Gilliamella apicola]OCG55616.1 prolipoprotein diacylglyceryl transferase [Gilliamella apicola]